MSIRHLVVTTLLRIYPAVWRAEYGPELSDILDSGPLSARVIGDVIWSGLRQRIRMARPSTILGLASMLVVLAGFILPSGLGRPLLRLTSMTFPTVEVTFLSTEVYAFLLIGCGCWTRLKYGGTASQAGIDAMKMSLIASIPIVLGSLLVALGILDVMFFFGSETRPHVLAIMVAPFARLPLYWIYGAIGGKVGRWIACRRRTTAAS